MDDESSEVRQREKSITEGTDPVNFPEESSNSATVQLAQGTDHVPSVLSAKLESFSPRWRNWIIRGLFTWLMIFGFAFIVYLGPLYMVLLVMCIELMCFREIINIGYVVYKAHDLPWFRTLSWALLLTSNYFLYGESFIDHFRVLLKKEEFLTSLIVHHHFISFSLYCCCVVGFVLSLRKKHYLKQFTLFGWTHVTLLILVTSSHCIMENIFHGIIWFLIPVAMIICNDIMAYMFGFFFGKTPLIKLSPKKTWEGFIGGGLSTIVFSLVFALILMQYDYHVCPLEYDDTRGELSMDCERNPVFVSEPYTLPKYLKWLPVKTVPFYPYFYHCIYMALFASIVGPFGGFFASGFKRAFNIKDFGDIIPGHGGIMDRFDCQLLMGAFTYVYYQSFIRVPGPKDLLKQIYVLSPEEQMSFYQLLTNDLVRRGVLPSP
jgi:phosphatidate cytidylyltransferase